MSIDSKPPPNHQFKRIYLIWIQFTLSNISYHSFFSKFQNIVHIFGAQQQAPDLSVSLRLEELIQKADGDVNLKIRKMLKTVESPLPILLLGVDWEAVNWITSRPFEVLFQLELRYQWARAIPHLESSLSNFLLGCKCGWWYVWKKLNGYPIAEKLITCFSFNIIQYTAPSPTSNSTYYRYSIDNKAVWS